MLKVTKDGIINFGDPIELTTDDLETLACIISDHSSLPTVRKKNGRWIQQNTLDILEGGYRVFTPSEDEAYA